MRIGINALQMESRSGHSKAGLSRYASSLIDALIDLKTEHQFTVYVNQNFEIPPAWGGATGWRFVRTSGKIGRMAHVWGRVAASAVSREYDVWLSLAHTLPIATTAKRILVVHDLFSLTNPELYVARRAKITAASLRAGIKKADRLIAVSESTKRELHTKLGVPLDKVTVTHLGPGNDVKRRDPSTVTREELEKIGIAWPRFLFMLSTIEPRKNVPRLLEAFAKVACEDRFSGLGLAIGGGKGWEKSEVFELPSKLGIKDRVKFLGYVADQDLTTLFAKCDAFVLPSLTEGFGITVLEAMLGGAPVVCSNTGSLPEVGGNAARYFDPLSVDDMAQTIAAALDSMEPRSVIVEKGLDQASQFDWKKTAEGTLRAIEEARR
jgi:glycosyltransferase involved in cell wall biosynthesis